MCVHVDVYITVYSKIILPFIVFNMKHVHKRKLVCQVVTHSTTPLSYVSSTFKIYENYYILFTKYVFVATLYMHGTLLYVWQLIPVQCGQ